MATVYTKRGEAILIDDEDFAFASAHRWRLHPDGSALSHINGRSLYLHRVLTRAPRGMEVDHINGNKSDNRRSNLRVCTRRENERNKPKVRKASSRFKGVCFRGGSRPWAAHIQVDGRQIYLGLHGSEESAARAYDKAALEHFGQFAYPNFPVSEAA